MNQEKITLKRALISVSDKKGIVEFAQALAALNIEIISTGGTFKTLAAANIPVRDVASLTGFPEMMDGRVKTLHPNVHGGILGLRAEHAEVARQQGIEWIDLVVVNLYPFADTIKKPNVAFDEAIENIDIGGPTMIRSAAKNMAWVGVVIDPLDYNEVLAELTREQGLCFATRKKLATKAFLHTAEYDRIIHHYLATQDISRFLGAMDLHLERWAELRYGENPHQKATAYQLANQSTGILAAKQYQGKQLSFNNIMDSDAALACVEEFSEPACVIVKHANPCGVAMAKDISTAFNKAFTADSLSAFGGVVALNKECDKLTAEALAAIFFEVIIAPSFTLEALAVFAAKPNLRVLEFVPTDPWVATHELRFIRGGVLFQDRDTSSFQLEDINVVTQVQPTQKDLQDLTFAYQVVKHVKSNAIVIAKQNVTLGIGAGQVSRVDAVELALKKAGPNLRGAVLASDAFFPFRDSIDRLAGTGVRAIIQPGGSVRDTEVIAACDEQGIAMIFTGVRSFKH
jgi:phosphoribosylaminoimidazolecarboxamide formyltransferase/IMP cyclohydrolase